LFIALRFSKEVLVVVQFENRRSLGAIASAALPFFLHSCGIKDRAGGYLCEMNAEKQLVHIEKIGTVSAEKDRRYKSLAEEKCHRLLAHPTHNTSYESRNPNNDKWGGAIRLIDGAAGFSGLAELDDEAFVMTLAIVAGHMRIEKAKGIAAPDNSTFQKVIDRTVTDPILWRIAAECRPRRIV
jgi:hypothetical protein